MGKLNVLMTGAGAPGAAGIIKCLHEDPSFQVVAADARSDAHGRYLAADFETLPKAEDPVFIDRILEIAERKKIDIILPLVTRELIPLAANRQILSDKGIKVPLSPLPSLEIANNKSSLYEFLQWRGIPVPEFCIVETIDQFREALVTLGHPSKKVCFKPSVANGSRGFRVITSQLDELEILFQQKPGSVMMRAEEAIRILSQGEFPQLLVSEWLPGAEYSVDCLADKGKALLVLPRLRKKMVNGISVEGEFVQDTAIIGYCTRIISELQLHGNIGIQVKATEKGQWLLLEINPRVQGTISAALGAGVNLPVLGIRQEMGLPITEAGMQIRWGARFSRYWEEVFY